MPEAQSGPEHATQLPRYAAPPPALHRAPSPQGDRPTHRRGPDGQPRPGLPARARRRSAAVAPPRGTSALDVLISPLADDLRPEMLRLLAGSGLDRVPERSVQGPVPVGRKVVRSDLESGVGL